MWYVVDGMDGCGKSSAADFIKEQLEAQGRRVLLITHPNKDTKIGRKEAAYLLKEGKFNKIMATVYYIRDVLHSVRLMKKLKKTGEYDDYIFVRFIMAVSYVPTGLGKIAYKFFKTALPEPDVKFLIDVTAETAMSRITSRGEAIESFENMEDLKKTRDRMHVFLYDNWHLIDNNKTFEDAKTQISEILEKVN